MLDFLQWTLNIVSNCRFFFIFKRSRALKMSWKISRGGPGKSWFFWSVKEWEPRNADVWLRAKDTPLCVSAGSGRTLLYVVWCLRAGSSSSAQDVDAQPPVTRRRPSVPQRPPPPRLDFPPPAHPEHPLHPVVHPVVHPAVAPAQTDVDDLDDEVDPELTFTEDDFRSTDVWRCSLWDVNNDDLFIRFDYFSHRATASVENRGVIGVVWCGGLAPRPVFDSGRNFYEEESN